MNGAMSHTLVIVESPTKARTINKYLGKGYTVLASVGHVRDLPKSAQNAVDIESGFVPNYVIPVEKRHIISEIAREAKKADEVLLASDPDREGEAIAWHIKEAAGLKGAKRVVFHEITEEAIKEALKHPRAIDTHLREAQEARRVLDRLVGYDLSGLIWKKVRYGLSAGRVQSPALRILMERERDIRAFIPETYFVIDAVAKVKAGSFPVTLSEEPKTQKDADAVLEAIEKASWTIGEVKETQEARQPRPPFTTSTLQQAASTRLGFQPSRTMRAAQKLYEAGHITYMRTDSVNLAKGAVAMLTAVASKEFGEEHVVARGYKTSSKNAQEAHEAVRPTQASRKSAGNTGDERALYDLIRSRALASQMKNAEVLRTKISVRADNIPDFVAHGSRVLYPGWLLADPRARSEDVELPKVVEKESAAISKVTATEKQTEPPKRYTEAGLIKELEKRGIGRPSTYASIMKTLVDRGYVERQNRTLIPTVTGDVVSTFLEEHFKDYISDSFTAEMENELDDIARGEREYEPTLKAFYTPFRKAVAEKEDVPKLTNLGHAPKKFSCPICRSSMHYKLGRGGVFMSCDRFPDCEGTRGRDGEEIKESEPIGTHPETGEPIFVKVGRYGPYVELGVEEKGSKKKTKKGTIPPGVDVKSVTVEDALKYLSLPRALGPHPDTGEIISAGIGKFGPFIVHQKDFRSLKQDDVYTIELPRALEIFKEPKRGRRGMEVLREVGLHPKTKKPITLYKSKSGVFLKRGLKNIYLPEGKDPETLTVEEAVELVKKK
jgi:DNA topoisomerase-1